MISITREAFEIPTFLNYLPDMAGKPIDAVYHANDCNYSNLDEL